MSDPIERARELLLGVDHVVSHTDAWSRRIAPRVVLAANDEYLPGRGNFAVRGGDGNLREVLRAVLPEHEGEFAHGHPRATGGSVGPETFERLLTGLGGAR